MQVAEEIAVHNDGASVTTLSLGPRTPGDASDSLDREERTSRGVPVTHKRSVFSGSLLRRARLPAVILQAAQRERYGLLLVSEEGDQAGGALLTRPFLEDLFRAAPCPVLALRCQGQGAPVAELAFVGLGLGDERGLSARAWDVLRAAEEVFAEEYTAVAPDGTLDRVSAELHRRVQPLDRSLLESERPILDALDRSARVALIVVGDPFAATTHVALRLAAERAGHTWTYVPNASVLTAAAGFLGLMHYRFGRTVSFPFPAPASPPAPR